ncbi:hypothetical protein EG327_008369 [Venturia inaequalis]|uniref:Uncharacterized protein n=1 Tax=Venturia inaequalis TaxID=5025 RepID=A0A8H3VQE6_VENIN|nr:hypothetical protein EG327_008369 [Venturia inaequalis]
MKPFQFLSLFLVFIPATIAATPTTSAIATPSSNPDTLGEGCVDPRNYVKCNTKQQDDFVTCGTRCNVTNANVDCLLGCGVSRDTAVFGCVVKSCWNKVYTCEYQMTALNFIIVNDLIHDQPIVPFYPPPPNAAGACSCNIGNAYSNMTVRKPDSICQDLVGSGGDNLKRCECCESSRYFSGAVNTCPRTDLSIIALDVYFKGAVNNVPQVDVDCAPLLNSDKCTEEFGMKLGSGTEFYNLLSLPPGVPGTQAISDVGAFTTFPGPQTTTLKMFGGYSSVITMAPWTAGSGGSDWNSIKSHKDFEQTEAYLPFVQKIGTIMSGPVQMRHAEFRAPLATAAVAPIVELLTLYFPDHVDRINVDTTLVEFIQTLVDNAKGFVGYTTGWVAEELEHEKIEGKARAYAVAIGWESLEAHMAYRDTQTFKDNIVKVRAIAKGLTVYHVEFIKA